MKRNSLDRFIFERNGVLTFKKRVPGRSSPLQISLETSDRALAREKRDGILKDLAEKELTEIRGPRSVAKVGQVLQVFRTLRSIKEVQECYVQECVGTVYNYISHANGAKVPADVCDAMSLEQLFSPALFAKFRRSYFAGYEDDRERLKSRQRGAASVMRHLHAVFSKDAQRLYRHLAIPGAALAQWLADTRIEAEPRQHVPLSDRALAEMHAAIEPFYEAWPDFWLVHALHKFSGLRNEEIRNIRVEWFARAPWGQVFIICKTRPYYEFKGTDGSVPVHSSVVPLLQKFVKDKKPLDFLLGTERPKNWQELTGYRSDGWEKLKGDNRKHLVDRVHAHWMRTWTPANQFAKRGYELRRWGAQMMQLKYGVDASHSFLRHARGSVAERHYLEEWNRWRQLGNDVGITLEEAQGKTNVAVLGNWQQGAAALSGEAPPEQKQAGAV